MTSQPVIRQPDNGTDRQPGNQADGRPDRPATGQPDRRTHEQVRPVRQGGIRKPGRGEVVRVRLAEAARLAQGPTTTVTLRVPRGMNDWLDEYVHRSWPAKVLKQDLVAEALTLLFARRGRAGEPVLHTDLLPNEGEP
jgi:hypothetical protein